MKKIAMVIVLLLLIGSTTAFADQKPLLNKLTSVSFSAEDEIFYMECFDNARINMHEPERSDPVCGYREQAEYCNSRHESIKKLMAKENKLWGYASEEDIPLEEAILLGYAALEKIAGVTRETMHKYFAEAWMNVSVPEKHVWQIAYAYSTFYRKQNESADRYYVYIDAQSGEIQGIDVL